MADGATLKLQPRHAGLWVASPAGPINHHWTKNLIASRDGSKLYVTVGSNSNVGERASAVGVALDKTGALLVADDVGNRVWRVSAMR